MKSMYYQASECISLAGGKRNMTLIDELFVFLTRLRQELFGEDQADLPEPYDSLMTDKGFTVGNILAQKNTWLNIQAFIGSKA